MTIKPELLQYITSITSKIHDEFPELSKYIDEMPADNSVGARMMTRNLENYYDSLEKLLANYADAYEVRKVSV